MTTLHLTLKKKWFDMIASKEKQEEYREIKEYWEKRLEHSLDEQLKNNKPRFKKYDKVTFKNGYSKNARTISFVLKSISCGIGVEKWGAPTDKSVYIISLGSKISNDFEFGKRCPCKSKSIKIYDNCIVYDGKFIDFYAKDRDIQSRILVAIIKQIKEESEEIIRQLRCSTENEKQHREYLLSETPNCFLP